MKERTKVSTKIDPINKNRLIFETDIKIFVYSFSKQKKIINLIFSVSL